MMDQGPSQLRTALAPSMRTMIKPITEKRPTKSKAAFLKASHNLR